MLDLKTMKSELSEIGYTQAWKLVKESNISGILSDMQHDKDIRLPREPVKSPLCQTIDLIVPEKERNSVQERQLQQFLAIIGSPYSDESEQSNDNYDGELVDLDLDIQTSMKPIDNEQREWRIQEFIKTEKSYVDSLQTMVDLVIKPLKANTSDSQSILNPFKIAKIFLNIEHILPTNQTFLDELEDWQNNKLNTSFGSICAKHMPHFECYRKYLMDQEEAQKLHVKEVKSNQKYRKFLAKAKENPAFRRRKLQDILVEPVQRISRYTMMLKEILKRTAQDSKEHEELTDACNISSRIAKMKDDTPTKLATMSLSLYTSIKDSPCSLISQHRELIDYMDFVEINRETSKPIRAVTLFLFNDKLLIASRPSNAKGADLCNIIEKENTSILSKVGMLKPLDRSSRRDASLKFKAWADIEQIELVGGTSDFVGSFFLHTLPAPQQENVPFSTLGSFEAYLHKGTRMYTPIPHKDYTLTADGIKALLKRKDEFIEAFHRTQALARNSEEQKIAYYREWAGKDAYITLHDTDSYHSARYKNHIVVVYVDGDEALDTSFLLQNTNTAPWVVALVQADMRGFRFHLSSKIKSSQAHKKSTEKNTSDKPADTKTVDFESIFWNNLLICEHRVRSSQAFYDSQEVAVVEEGQKLTRSSSKSFSRPNSILGLRKLLSYGDIRSRSSSSTPPSSIEQTSSLRRSSSRHSSELSMDISRNDEEKQDKSPKDPAISRSFPSQLLSSNGMDSSYNTYEYGSSSSANSSIVVSSKSTGFSYNQMEKSRNYRNSWSTINTEGSIDYTSPRYNNLEIFSNENTASEAKEQDNLLPLSPPENNFRKNSALYEAQNGSAPLRNGEMPNLPTLPHLMSTTASIRHFSSQPPSLSSNSSPFNTFSSTGSQSIRSSADIDDCDMFGNIHTPSPLKSSKLISALEKSRDDDLSRKVQELLLSSPANPASNTLPVSHLRKSSLSSNNDNSPMSPIFNTHEYYQDGSKDIRVFGEEAIEKMDILMNKQKQLGYQIDKIGQFYPEGDESKALKDIYKDVYNDMCLLYNKMADAQYDKVKALPHFPNNQGVVDNYFESADAQQIVMLEELRHAQTERDYWEQHARKLDQQLHQ